MALLATEIMVGGWVRDSTTLALVTVSGSPIAVIRGGWPLDADGRLVVA